MNRNRYWMGTPGCYQGLTGILI